MGDDLPRLVPSRCNRLYPCLEAPLRVFLCLLMRMGHQITVGFLQRVIFYLCRFRFALELLHISSAYKLAGGDPALDLLAQLRRRRGGGEFVQGAGGSNSTLCWICQTFCHLHEAPR